MSGVSNGDLANESTFDSAYMYANGDTGTVGKVSLQNTDPLSGATVVNAQRLLNELADADGVAGEGDPNAKIYSSANYIQDGDDRKVAIAKLDDQLFMTQTQLDELDALNSQDVSLGPIGTTPNTEGMTLIGQTLNLEPASATNGGVLTAGTQTIGGNKTFQNDVTVTGNTVLNGNLTVNGTTTTVNSATVDTVDPNITVNKTGNDVSAEGSGLTVDRTGTKGSLAYENALASKFKIGDLASEAEVATVSHAQTFTNKTISGLTNTLTNIPAANLTGTIPISSGGTGQSNQTAAFDALSPLTTKGDLIVNDGTNDIRLGVGTNTQVLTADSAAPSGVKWAVVSAPVVALNVVSVNVNYTALSTDDLIVVDAGSGIRTITLPTAVGITGKKYIIKKVDSSANAVVIDANASETIDGGLTFSLFNTTDLVEIVSNGTGWYIININVTKESFTAWTTGTYTQTANVYVTAPLAAINSRFGFYSIAASGVTIRKTAYYKVILKNTFTPNNGESSRVAYSINNGADQNIGLYGLDSNASGSVGHIEEAREVFLTAGDVIRLRTLITANTRNGTNGFLEVVEM